MRPYSNLKSVHFAHIVFKVQESKPWQNISEMWIFLSHFLERHSQSEDVVFHSFVLMNNHGHILVNSTNLNLQKKFILRLISQLKEANTLCEAFEEPIISYPQYKQTYKYIYQNPVTAGLVDKAEQYPYSTLRQLLGYKSTCECPLPIIDNMNLIYSPQSILAWINNQI